MKKFLFIAAILVAVIISAILFDPVAVLILLIFAGLIVFLIGLATFHRLSLCFEKKKLGPPGRFVYVNGHSMHVYSEGDNQNAPLLVFLSGAATPAPVYDFKPLYALLSKDYRIVVVERAGYGYSEVAKVPRDIDTILAETREALRLAGEASPYVLVPHSLSGLESIRWAQRCPDEIKGIIALDIAVPAAYTNQNASSRTRFVSNFTNGLIRLGAVMGITRLGVLHKAGDLAQTPDEQKQTKLLLQRNFYNKNVMDEILTIFTNAKTIEDSGIPKLPVLFFTAPAGEPQWWVNAQNNFVEADSDNVTAITFTCGHYIHQFEPEHIAEESKKFIDNLGRV